jgi:hypothetical protein
MKNKLLGITPISWPRLTPINSMRPRVFMSTPTAKDSFQGNPLSSAAVPVRAHAALVALLFPR